jgi:hypothetical protein
MPARAQKTLTHLDHCKKGCRAHMIASVGINVAAASGTRRGA